MYIIIIIIIYTYKYITLIPPPSVAANLYNTYKQSCEWLEL